jgi:hypothetical protein
LGVGGEAAELAVHPRGGRVPRGIEQHTLVVVIGGVEVVIAVQGDASQEREAVGADAAVIPCVAGETAELTVHPRRGRAAREIEQHASVASVGDIQIPAAVQGETPREAEAVGADAALVDRVGGEAAELAVDPRRGRAPGGIEQHALIVRVGDVETAAAVQGDAIRAAETTSAEAARVHVGRGEIGLPVHGICRAIWRRCQSGARRHVDQCQDKQHDRGKTRLKPVRTSQHVHAPCGWEIDDARPDNAAVGRARPPDALDGREVHL